MLRVRVIHNRPELERKMPIGQDPDLQIVKQVQQGTMRAYDLLVLKYQGRVMALISRFVSDRSITEDIAQESFLKAYRAINSFKGNSAFYTWLYRISVNTAKNYLAQQSRRTPYTDVSMDDFDGSENFKQLHNQTTPENSMARDQLEKLLNRAIAELPAELQQAFKFREFDGLSYEEIAEMMNSPIGTVRSRIFRAREQIEQKIKM